MALSPAAWSMVQQMGRLLLASVFYFGIAGLLNPGQVGILGIATVWIAFLGVFADLGLGAALIQRKEIDDRHRATVFFVNVAIGIVLFLAGAAASWPTSRLMKTPEAQPVILVLSAGFIIGAFSTVQAALAARELRFRALALRDLGGVLVGGMVGLGLAYLGWGTWSLVAQSLTTALVGAVLLWGLSPYRPRLRDWSSRVLRDLWGYGSRLFGLNLFKYFVQNADALVIGYFFGPAKLGLYALATKVLTQPIVAVESGVGTFLFSQASRLQDERRRVADLYAASYKALNYLVLPFVATAAVWGGILAPAILGREWRGLGSVFGFLAIMGALHPPITPMGQVLKALGKPGWLVRWSIVFSIATIGALLAGTQYGFIGALTGLAGAYLAMLPLNFIIIERLLPGSLRRVLRAVAPTYAAGAAFTAVLLGFRVWRGDNIGAAVMSTVIAMLLYVVLVRQSDPAFTSLLRRQLVGLRAA